MSEIKVDSKLYPILESHFNYSLNAKHFSDFGKMVSYDPNTCTASIQPAPKVLYDKGNNEYDEVEQSVIHDVPVLWASGYGNFVIHGQPQEGDQCLIIFTQNDNSQYDGTGVYNVAPHRMFSYNNATCIPILTLKKITQLDGIAIQTLDGSSYIQLSSNGNILLHNSGGTTTFNSDGSVVFPSGAKVTADGDFVSKKGVSHDGHRHDGNKGWSTSIPYQLLHR